LVLLDNRGTGASAMPSDPQTYRVDRLVDDVEALRVELGLDEMDLLGHSASGGVCMLYAAAHPDRLRSLVLADPSLRVVGLESDLGAEAVAAERSHEPWYDEATVAYRASKNSRSFEEAEQHWFASAPFSYGPWNDRAKSHAGATMGQFSKPATEGFYAGYEPDVVSHRARLSELDVLVLVIVGEHDLWPTSEAATDLVSIFRAAELTVIEGAGHFPWVDDPETFADTVARFLAQLFR
jgi:pimeloyl-ACP methyl ester carboxylesterase